MEEPEKRSYVTNKDLQLELKSLRTEALAAETRAAALVDVLRRDFKVWLVGAVALNNFLAGVEVPSVVTGSVVLGIVVKGAIAWFAKT